MAIGLSRQEQWAIIGVITLILTGIGLHTLKQPPAGEIVIDRLGRWEKLAQFPTDGKKASQPLPQLNSQSTTSTQARIREPDRSATPAMEPPAENDPAAAEVTTGLDLNLATAEELERLPGIGPAKAQAILDTRQRLGGFTKVEQLDEVKGIGPATVEKLRPYVFAGQSNLNAKPSSPLNIANEHNASAPVHPPASSSGTMGSTTTTLAAFPAPAVPRININTASAEELIKLKGVGPVLAQRIIADRRANGPYKTPEELDRVPGIGPAKLQALRPLITTH